MDISLPNNIENILKEKISEGIFSSMDAAISFAIQFAFVDNKISQERLDTLNEEIEKGWQDMQKGNYKNSDLVFKDLRKNMCNLNIVVTAIAMVGWAYQPNNIT